MKKYILIFLLSALSVSSDAKQVNMMLHLNRILQVDTLGQNIVELLPPLLYPFILEGKIKLWDGPLHKIRIEPDALKNLEAGTKTRFSNTQELFLFENWNIDSKEISVNTLGMTFTNKNFNGEEVSYGFADFKDIMDAIGKLKVPVNANGNSNTTFEQLFAYRKFDFNIVQYGNKTMKSIEESMKLKIQTLKGRNFQSKIPMSPQNKIVEYIISKPIYPVNKAEENSAEILSSVGTYLSSHMEDFLNMGGDAFTGGKLNYKVSVSKIIITEDWSRKNAIIQTFPISIQVFVNDKPLKQISYNQVKDWNIYVNLFGLDDLISDKQFDYSIIKINQQEIPSEKSEVYLKGLREYDWSKLTEYVKYF